LQAEFTESKKTKNMNRIYTLIISALCMLSITLEARTVQEASAVASAFMQAQNEAMPAKRIQKAAAAENKTLAAFILSAVMDYINRNFDF
jgi:flagellin-specific chaperone FliS